MLTPGEPLRLRLVRTISWAKSYTPEILTRRKCAAPVSAGTCERSTGLVAARERNSALKARRSPRRSICQKPRPMNTAVSTLPNATKMRSRGFMAGIYVRFRGQRRTKAMGWGPGPEPWAQALGVFLCFDLSDFRDSEKRQLLSERGRIDRPLPEVVLNLPCSGWTGPAEGIGDIAVNVGDARRHRLYRVHPEIGFARAIDLHS